MFAHVDCDAVCSRWAAKQAPISPEGPSFFFSFLPPPPSLSPTCFSRDILSETARRPRWLSHVPAEEGDGKEKTSWRDRNRVYSLRLILFLCSLLSKGFYNVLGTWSLSLRLALVLKMDRTQYQNQTRDRHQGWPVGCLQVRAESLYQPLVVGCEEQHGAPPS